MIPQWRDGAAKLFVGMPAYNNARTLREALQSLLDQSMPDLRILVSDDGSSDGSADIAERIAETDPRLAVVRQPRNLNYGNFRFVLAQASTPFFMFAAGDDRWHRDYAARMIDALDATPSAVCAVSRVMFTKGDQLVREASGTSPLLADPATNVRAFLAAGDDNSRMYGVFRTDVAKRAFPPTDFFAYDWAFSIGTLLEGTHIQIPEVMMWRDYTEPSRYIEYVRRDAANGILSRVFPLLPLSRDLVRRLRIPRDRALIRELVGLNGRFHLAYLQRFHPAAEPFARAAFKAIRLVDRAIRLA